MKDRRWMAWMLAGMLVMGLGGCKGKEPEPEVSSSQPEVVDPNYPVALGDIRVMEKPESIVSLSPALTEVLGDLGGMDRLTGVSDFCDTPSSVDGIPRCGTAQQPNLDAIKAAAPQVVFASSQLSQENTVQLQQMGAEVVILPSVESMDGLEELYITMGTILDGMVDGEQRGVDTFLPLRSNYDAVLAAAAGVTPVSAIYLRMLPLTMATGDTFEGVLLEEIGFENAAKEFAQWDFPADKAVDLYPEVIFYDDSIDPQYFKDNKVYNTTNAVKNGKLFPVDASAFERQSGRMITELVKMFTAVYPEIPVEVGTVPTPEPEQEPADPPAGEGASSEEEEEVLELEDATQIIE